MLQQSLHVVVPRLVPAEEFIHGSTDFISVEQLRSEQVSFRQRFRHTPLWRSKRRGVLRNAAIVLGNHPADDSCAALELGLNDPEPIVRAAIRWLRRNPPPPPERLAIVHGDYRTGNFLFDEQGRVTAILDWEMCHLGDPLEDLGWALDPLWAGTTPERPGQLLDRTRGLSTWEGASGLTVDQNALRWWEIFAHVKGSAIWISGSREYASGTNHDPVLLISGWLCTARHAEIIAERFVHLLEEPP